MLMFLFRFALTIFAFILIIVGVITTPTPVPFGIIFIVLGLLLLSSVAPNVVRWLRRHWRWFDRQMLRVEKRLPNWIAKHLRKSHVEREDEEEAEAR